MTTMRLPFSIRWCVSVVCLAILAWVVLACPMIPVHWHGNPSIAPVAGNNVGATRAELEKWFAEHEFARMQTRVGSLPDEFRDDFEVVLGDDGLFRLQSTFYERNLPCGATIVVKVGLGQPADASAAGWFGWDYRVNGLVSCLDDDAARFETARQLVSDFSWFALGRQVLPRPTPGATLEIEAYPLEFDLEQSG